MRFTKFPYNLPWLIRLALWHRGIFRIQTHLTAAELVVLYRLARDFGTPGVLEIGSYLGASASALAAGLTDAARPGPVHCVDTWQNHGMTEGARDTWTEFSRNIRSWGDKVRPHRGWSHELAAGLAGELAPGLSLVFFDGDHSYDGVRRDWESFRPLLAPGAVVAFHDVGWAEGVQRLVAEAVEPRAVWAGRLPNLYWAQLRDER